jgi:hypothetical protein
MGCSIFRKCLDWIVAGWVHWEGKPLPYIGITERQGHWLGVLL